MGEDSVGIVRGAFEAFARRDREAQIGFAHPEIEIHLLTSFLTGRHEPYRGHQGVAEYLDDVDAVWDEIEIQPREFVELSEDQVLVVGRARVRRGATRMDVPNAWLCELADGRVRSVRLLVDAESVAPLLAARADDAEAPAGPGR